MQFSKTSHPITAYDEFTGSLSFGETGDCKFWAQRLNKVVTLGIHQCRLTPFGSIVNSLAPLPVELWPAYDDVRSEVVEIAQETGIVSLGYAQEAGIAIGYFDGQLGAETFVYRGK